MRQTFQAGDLLDKYHLDELVAATGRSSVFRVTELETGRKFAVKVPRGNLASRFFGGCKSQDQLARRLDHPGVVRVLANCRSNPTCLVMEWVEGRLLREIIQEEGTLSIERSLRITARICSVLAYIHQLGIVHLDLKPDNLIVDPADNIRLIDFDLAREIKPRFWSWLRPKHSGTPDYASPEQILGKSIGVQSDLYALGMILYEMLTGEVPFSGLGPATAVKLRALADPLPPSEINPDVPAELDNLICRTVARSPEKRPVNAKRLCEELESLARLCAGNRVVSV